LQMKISGSTEFIFFLVLLLPVLPGVVLAAARVGTILYFVQDSCNLD